jgi:hypothetical protein
MHPVILFGYRSRRSTLGQLTYPCPRCHLTCPHVVVKEQSRFSLFLVPLFSMGSLFKAICKNCGYEERVSKQQVQQYFPGRL